MQFVSRVYNDTTDQTTFSYKVSTDSYVPNSNGLQAGKTLGYVVFGIEKCTGTVQFQTQVTSLITGAYISSSSGSASQSTVDSSTCVSGVKVDNEVAPGNEMTLTVTMSGDIYQGLVTYALSGLSGDSRFVFDAIEGPNCECVPETTIITPEWSPWASWSDCDCASCGKLGRQTRSRSCSDPALEAYGNNDFCPGPHEQFRECSMDTELCTLTSGASAPNATDNRCGVVAGTVFSECANQCSLTCMSTTSPESCNDDDAECEPGCVCPHPMVLDVSAEACVMPASCSCYDFVCDSFVENGEEDTPTCCPERTCSCVDGVLECTGECPRDCAATEWSEWSTCDSQCKRSRSRCILEHGDFGGRECDGGEYEEEYCAEDTATCAVCLYNGTEYRNNDVVESSLCYQTICVDNGTQVELRCDEGPSGPHHCADDEIYVPPGSEDEAAGQNCCGRCEKKKCRAEEICLTVNLTKADGSFCGERNVTVEKCVGTCGDSSSTPSLNPYAVNPDLYFSIKSGSEAWYLADECKCCKGHISLIERKMACDDGHTEHFYVPTATGCECRDCSGSGASAL